MIIGFAGEIASGKSFVSNHLAHLCGGKVINFADPLYKIANIFDPKIKQGMSQEAKLDKFLARPEWTRREALQRIGTELFRHQVNYDCWTDIFKREVEYTFNLQLAVFCGDVRFPNELETIKQLGGFTLWLDRPSTQVKTTHTSGNSISSKDCYGVISNEEDIATVRENIFYYWQEFSRSKVVNEW